MKLIGVIAALCVLVGVVGFFRGWFAVNTAHAGGHRGLTVTLDRNEITDDTQALRDHLTAPSDDDATTSEALPNDVEGVLTRADAAARILTIEVDGEITVQPVPADVPISGDGTSLSFADLGIDSRIKLVYATTHLTRSLTDVEVLR